MIVLTHDKKELLEKNVKLVSQNVQLGSQLCQGMNQVRDCLQLTQSHSVSLKSLEPEIGPELGLLHHILVLLHNKPARLKESVTSDLA